MDLFPTAVGHRLVPALASKAAIEVYAEEIANALSFNPGDALEPIVADLGGTIEYKNPISSGGSLPESIVIRSEESFTIYLGMMNSSERDRLTIAHELGHFFVHYPLFIETHPAETMVATRWVDETDQSQAAGVSGRRVGLPQHSSCLKRSSRPRACGSDLPSVAGLFAVSLSAAELRKRSLGA